MADLTVLTVSLLVLCGLVAGIGITTVGPGGVLVTAGLFLLTDLPPATIAGTAIVTHIATGIVGSAAYYRSGQLQQPATRRIALILCTTAVVGTPVGVLINLVVPSQIFGTLLAVFLVLIAVLVWRRNRRSSPDEQPHHGRLLLVIGGFVVAIASGMFGVGGPLLTVPLLVAVGTPILPALAASQVQSIVISTVGTLGYLSQGAIDWSLAAVVGIPEMVGVVIGWRVARHVPPAVLKRVMILALLAVVPFLLLRG